ncbi:hypothetical protein D4R52_00190 [bacterium]|nr:MAG: hypothetical protein D4R52_00190 [bacterium]
MKNKFQKGISTAAVVIMVIIVAGAGGYLIYNFEHNKIQASALRSAGSGTNSTPVPAADTGSNQAPQDTITQSPVPAVKTFNVTAQNLTFSPSVINVKKNDTIVINFQSMDIQHNFKLDQFHVVSDTVSGGQKTTVQFVANQTGTFEFYCGVGSHRDLGMVGQLIVQ